MENGSAPKKYWLQLANESIVLLRAGAFNNGQLIQLLGFIDEICISSRAKEHLFQFWSICQEQDSRGGEPVDGMNEFGQTGTRISAPDTSTSETGRVKAIEEAKVWVKQIRVEICRALQTGMSRGEPA